jgi:type IV secretion system protein VirB1
MKTFLVMTLLLLPPAALGQNTDVTWLQSICLPTAPLSTLRAVIQVESSGNPNAMQIDFPKTLLKRWSLAEGTLRLKRQPANQREALAWLTYFQSYDIFVDLGLMQVSTAEAKRRGISPETLLEPCTNLRVGWQILEDDYRIEQKTHGPGQEALQHAISRYNTGDTRQGIANGYLGRVLAAVPSPSVEPRTEKR